MSSFQKATRHKAKLRLGIAGTAGSGKTYSALLIAQGLGKKIALIDTEHGSGELYANLCEYDVATIEPPFTVDKYVKLIKEAGEVYDVVIIDSLTHAWAGEGGLLDYQDKIAKTQKGGNSYTAWREVTPKHNQLVDAMLQSFSHIIATVRSKQDYVLEENGGGKKVPKKVGLAPVQREGMEYEFTVFFDLTQEHLCTVTKDRTSMFDDCPFKPSIETGQKLLQWLESGDETPKHTPPATPYKTPSNGNGKVFQSVEFISALSAYKEFYPGGSKNDFVLYIEQQTGREIKNVTVEQYKKIADELNILIESKKQNEALVKETIEVPF